MKRGMILLIRFYKKYISPFFPASCRFYPTCSKYCEEAIEKYGAIKGFGLWSKRILRCNQFNKGGFDPVR